MSIRRLHLILSLLPSRIRAVVMSSSLESPNLVLSVHKFHEPDSKTVQYPAQSLLGLFSFSFVKKIMAKQLSMLMLQLQLLMLLCWTDKRRCLLPTNGACRVKNNNITKRNLDDAKRRFSLAEPPSFLCRSVGASGDQFYSKRFACVANRFLRCAWWSWRRSKRMPSAKLRPLAVCGLRALHPPARTTTVVVVVAGTFDGGMTGHRTAPFLLPLILVNDRRDSSCTIKFATSPAS